MRICYIASPGIHTNPWLKYFADNGHEVHLITTESSRGSTDNVKLHLLKRFGPRIRIINYLVNSIPLILRFKKLIRNINPDIIHAHYIMDTTLLGAVCGFHPFVVTVWGSDVLISPKQSKLSRQMARYVLKRADLADKEKTIELFEDCGFSKEGILRDKIFKDGKFRDVMVMSIIKGDKNEYKSKGQRNYPKL